MTKGFFKEKLNDGEISYKVENGIIKTIVINNIIFNNLEVSLNEFSKEKLIEVGGF